MSRRRHARPTRFALAVTAIFLANAAGARAQGESVSEGTAFGVSLVGTLAPVAAGAIVAFTDPEGFTLSGTGGDIIGVGLLVGPSAGHFYARESGRALLGIGIRAAGLAAYYVARNSENLENSGVDAIGTLGVGLVVASAIADIAGAKKSARRHNERIDRQSTRVSPMLRLAGRSAGAGIRAVF